MLIEIDAEMAVHLDRERAGMRDMLLTIADHREADAEAARDPRYGEAAANLRHLADTVMQIDDELLLQVAMIAAAVEDHGGSDLVSEIISAKLLAVGFEIEPFADATALLRSIASVTDAAQATGRLRH